MPPSVTDWRSRLRSSFWFSRIQWLLLFARQLGLLGIGLTFSALLGLGTAGFTGLDNPSLLLYFLGVFCGFILTGFVFSAYRRKTRQWEVEFEIEVWMRGETERRLHPTRARCKRLTGRVLLWLPSALAALVLFFSPVLSHLRHPGSHYLKHYTVPIPWNMLAFSGTLGDDSVAVYMIRGWKGQFGIITIGDVEPLSSQMSFESLPRDSDFSVYKQYTLPRWPIATRKSARQFHFGPIKLICWEYSYELQRGLSSDRSLWEMIACTTPDSERERNLFATFRGGEADAAAFYRIIERIQPFE